MSLYRQYMNLLQERQEELNRHDKDGLVALLLNLESIFLYEIGRGDIGDADCEEDRRDVLSELQDFIRYHQIRSRVAERVDVDFTPENEAVRQQLIETVSQMVMSVMD